PPPRIGESLVDGYKKKTGPAASSLRNRFTAISLNIAMSAGFSRPKIGFAKIIPVFISPGR
ncbi:hypothetical protein, partial [Mesorhizobium sp. M7A.F.Ca.CA.003.01.2.1]|uniref:hypothetical protein n=1 Tax=Mesorhizobium sp. M7A.F.Ca.CA.003.01.2.1 TaxID=2496722 RepID=UPI0019D1E909